MWTGAKCKNPCAIDSVEDRMETAATAIRESDKKSRRGRRGLSGEPVRTPPPAVYPARRPLPGQRVRLEPLDPRHHAEELFQIGHSDDAALRLWTYLPYGPFTDQSEMVAWVRSCAGMADPVFLAVRDTQTDRLMGMASFLEVRPAIGVIEIGHIWFAPPFQNTLQSTDALFVMMRHAMQDLEYRRLEWKCNALNNASRDAALRLGFRFEGVFYNHNIVKGNNRDTSWYSILDSEWPAVRNHLESWLDPDNFDSQGRQRSSLSQSNRALW